MIEKILLQKGLVSKEDYENAKEVAKSIGKKPIEVLLESGHISKDDYLDIIASQLHIPAIKDLSKVRIKDIKIPIGILKQTLSVPVEESLNRVVVAMVDPLDWNSQSIIKRYFPNKEVVIGIAFEEDIKKILSTIENSEKVRGIIENIKRELGGAEIGDNQSSVMDFIEYIIRNAIYKKSSDIHIEPIDEAGAEIRFRIFGTLYKFLDFEYEIYNALTSRIKILANLDISERRKPQDGAFTMAIDGNSFDFRISTLPTIWGESIVIRILDKRNILKRIDEIGITEKNLSLLKKALTSPGGIFLVTGPTGSGKSTTLYASINEINSSSKKIITVEDPVEYKLKGIQQVQVNPRAGLDFASSLRSILRQDPDIIMIGEIRDLETLNIAIKAAMTGHLVIATLHTNDAFSAIHRMIDMGADPFMISTSLIGVEAQRLVKTVCNYCKTPYKPQDMYFDIVKNLPIVRDDTIFYKGVGCEKCNMTGYSGMTLITEIFLNDEKLESMIARNKDKVDMLEYLRSKGYDSMFFDGLYKAIKGITTLEEVFRVAKL